MTEWLIYNITGSFCNERAVYNSNGRKTLSASLSTGPLLKLISSLVLKETFFPLNVLFRWSHMFYASATGKAIYLHVITYLTITYMTRTLPTSPNTHTIEYNAVMMIATITGVELLSSSAVLSHLELFMFTRLELLLKFRQNTLLFDITGLESA